MAKIVLGQDNLSTHKPASLYEAFPPPEARRLVERFEWHYLRIPSRAFMHAPRNGSAAASGVFRIASGHS